MQYSCNDSINSVNYLTYICPKCQGTGEVNSDPCIPCKGSGLIDIDKALA